MRIRNYGGVADEIRGDLKGPEHPEHPVADHQANQGMCRPPRRLMLLIAIAAGVLIVDTVTKVIAVELLTPGMPVSIIGDTVTWTLVRNSGAAFSMATGYTWVLTLIAMGVVVAIIWAGRRLVSVWWAIGLGMILGGALGNLVDRFFRSPGPLRGHVIDFLSIGWWPVFNVADPAVVGGAMMLVVLSLLGYEFDTTGRHMSKTKISETKISETKISETRADSR